MQIKNKSKIASLLTAAVCSLQLVGAEYPAEGTLELEYPLPPAAEEKFGSIPANRRVATNVWDIVEALRTNILYKQDRFLFGKGFNMDTTYYKIFPVAQSDVDHLPPPHQLFYISDLNSSADVYGPNMRQLTRWSDSSKTGFGITIANVAAGEEPKLIAVNSAGHEDTWAFTYEPVKGLIVSLDDEKPTSYDWSHANDWRVMWRQGGDVDPGTGEEVTEHVGEATIRSDYQYTAIRNTTAILYVDYLDQVNLPNFGNVTYSIVDGAEHATINNDVLTTTSPGVVKVKATTDGGQERTCDVSMYQYKTTSKTEGAYTDDNHAGRCYAARNRVNNYHLDLLQRFRSEPTTNRHYTIWGDPSYFHNYANPGDHFTGAWASNFHPYQFIGVNSGGDSSFWWSHAAASKHVLVGAAHYGDYNHNRFLNGYEYFNYDQRNSGRAQVKMKKWYYLRDWAKDHGFEGDDANVGDISCWVIEGEVPDECLPYIASVDWLNKTYGCNIDAVNKRYVSNNLPCITYNQSNMLSLRSVIGVLWSGHLMTGPAGTESPYSPTYAIDGYKRLSRADIFEYASLGCWHTVRAGDSGHPTFLYDPALQGVCNGTAFVRPILLSTETSGSGGASYPRVTKVLRAFCKWVAEEKGTTLEADMPYILGDVDNQSLDSAVIEANAVEAMSN